MRDEDYDRPDVKALLKKHAELATDWPMPLRTFNGGSLESSKRYTGRTKGRALPRSRNNRDSPLDRITPGSETEDMPRVCGQCGLDASHAHAIESVQVSYHCDACCACTPGPPSAPPPEPSHAADDKLKTELPVNWEVRPKGRQIILDTQN
jgi:hypothetical protein